MKRLLFAVCAAALAASLLGLAAVLHQHNVQAFGAVDGLPDPALDVRPDNLLAVNVALERYDEAGLNRALDQLAAFGWVRQKFDLPSLFASARADPFSEWDGRITAVRQRDKKIIAVLMAPPTLAPQTFVDFSGLFAVRYAEQIDVYQILDEPNLAVGWGDQPPSAAQYAALLQAAYPALHAADPTATVLLAGLAPTTETGPDNISELTYLQQLYDLGAADYFDAVAGKPYGFYTGPDDRQADPQLLNFSRFTLLRQVMERNGDAHKLLWASNFGWNTRTDSPWGQAAPEQQVDYTLAAYQRARGEWPWAGPLALENYQPAAPPDDARWGFAISDPDGQLTQLGQTFSSQFAGSLVAFPGNYSAQHPAAQFTGAWEFSDLGADIPQEYAGAQIRIAFQGTDFALRVRRGDYRAYLYVMIDGQPANRLPRDERGAYLVLTSPDLSPEVATIPVASGLDPNHVHVAVIQPERGWDQWAFVGFSVGRCLPAQEFQLALSGLVALGVLGALGATYFGRSLAWGATGEKVRAVWQRLGDAGQLALTALVGGLLFLSAWVTFDTQITTFTRRFGDAAPLVITALTAGLFYFSPSFIVAMVALLALFGLFYLRLDLALAFIALFIPFFLFPRMLWERGASLLEFSLWLTFGAWALRNTRSLLASAQRAMRNIAKPPFGTQYREASLWDAMRLSSLDWGMLALLIVSIFSLFIAARKDVALYEFRTVILGPILFYFLLRVVPLPHTSLWRIVDFFLLGAVAIAAIGLYQYVTGTGLIVTEEGVARIRSVYGSPNNLGLYLGRALPVSVAVALMGKDSRRRWAYAVFALITGAALVLSFSRGALALGVPAALALILVFWQGRRGWMILGALAAVTLMALPALMLIPRFAGMFDWGSGTGFFRLNLWTSAWRMFLDHPLLGVGLDNFLYAYRSFYILPEAWQEPNLSHPHNIALDFLSRLGVLGFACGAWLVVNFWRAALSTHTHLKASLPSPVGAFSDGGRAGDGRNLCALCVGLMASMADTLAHGVVDHSFFLIDLAFVFCMTLALIQRLSAHNASEPV
jgi:O-antigen ligase